jgi:hypothetical protein
MLLEQQSLTKEAQKPMKAERSRRMAFSLSALYLGR